jgi:hypothetical protein
MQQIRALYGQARGANPWGNDGSWIDIIFRNYQLLEREGSPRGKYRTRAPGWENISSNTSPCLMHNTGSIAHVQNGNKRQNRQVMGHSENITPPT